MVLDWLVQSGVVICAWDLVIQNVVAMSELFLKMVSLGRACRAKHKRDQGVSKMGVSGGAHGLANGPHLAMKKTGISLIHRFWRRQHVAPARGGWYALLTGLVVLCSWRERKKGCVFICFNYFLGESLGWGLHCDKHWQYRSHICARRRYNCSKMGVKNCWIYVKDGDFR